MKLPFLAAHPLNTLRRRRMAELYWIEWKALAMQIGYGDAILYAIDRILSRIHPSLSVHRYHLVAQPVREKRLLSPTRGQSIQIRQIAPDDEVVREFARPVEEIEKRYDRGAVCFGAFRDHKLLGHIWLILGPYEEPFHRCVLIPAPEGSVAWDFDLHIEPTERLGFTFARLWDAANAYLRERNIRWTLSRISAFNPNSIASHRRLGARIVSSTTFLTLGPFQLLLANIAPYFYFSAHRRKVPVIVVKPPAGE